METHDQVFGGILGRWPESCAHLFVVSDRLFGPMCSVATANARVWGGMHFRHSCVEGVALGKRCGEKALERYLEAAKPPARNLRA